MNQHMRDFADKEYIRSRQQASFMDTWGTVPAAIALFGVLFLAMAL